MNEQRFKEARRLTDTPVIYRACFGKVRFPSKKNATARARTLPDDDSTRGPWNAYKCPRCHRWHVGHRRLKRGNSAGCRAAT